MTQQQIADIFNVSQLMVSRWKQQGAPLDDHQALCKWLRLASLAVVNYTRTAVVNYTSTISSTSKTLILI